MDLTTVHQGVQKHTLKKRAGRGTGSGHGKTSSRGYKGQGSRAGARLMSQLYEGGQMPLIRRMPKRGFSNATFRKVYAVINVDDLERVFAAGDQVDQAALKAKGLANGVIDGVRLLGNGALTKKLAVTVHHASASALEKVNAVGGSVALVPPVKKPVRNKMKPRPPKLNPR